MKRKILLLKQFLSQPPHKRAIYAWLVMVVFQLVLLSYKWRDLPPEVPLFYSRPWGEEQLASIGYLSLLPLSSLGAALLNGCIAILVHEHEKLLALILVWSVVVVTLIATIGLYRIVFLVS